MGRVLVVERDVKVAKSLGSALSKSGHEVRQSYAPDEALDDLRTWRPDLVILDLGVPGAEGGALAREIRATSDVPLLMLTERGKESDKIKGFEMGADDYVVRPFNTQELVMRVRAILRRTTNAFTSKRLTNGPLTMDVDERRVELEGIEVELSNKEFEILRILMERPGKVVWRADLASEVWGTTPEEAGKTIDVHLSWLRGKLGDDPQDPRYIETVRGVGFRFLRKD